MLGEAAQAELTPDRRPIQSRSFRQQADERRAALCRVRVHEVEADDIAEVAAAKVV
jgi:hypothetical protein